MVSEEAKAAVNINTTKGLFAFERLRYKSQPEDRVAMNATKQKNNSKPAAKVNKEQCRICKKFNHKEKDCYFRNKEKQPPIAFIAEQREEYDKRSSVTFIVDSGSTCHMINEEKLLDHQKKCDVNINVAKKEEVMRAKTSGQFKGRQCNLNEVIFVPELSKNLLSVTSIVNNGGEVNFKGDKVTILKDGKKVLEGDQLENGLYAVNIEQHFSKQNDSNLTLPSENKTQEWHRKLGHIGMQNLRKLESLVDGMELNKLEKQENDVCEICIMAKQTRKSFGNERSRATRPLEIVNTDLCGPIEPLTHDNKKYIMTFLDDYTHLCYVYLLSNKYEAKEYIKEYVNEVERFLNAKVSKLRCDNGGEYANTQVKEWCKMKGIILDFTIPYTPQLNGKAERLNRTLIEKTRALLLDSKLNKEMWGEATRVAAYLINRSPSNTVQTTPAQMWFGRKPNLSNVKLFGSEVYVKKLGNLKKLDSKSEKYSLIGYSGNGYRLWDMQKRRIIIARDVVFTGKLTNKMTSVIQPRYREDLDSEIEESQDTKMELDTHDKPQNSTNSRYMLRNRENINRPERLKDYEVLNSVSEEIGLLTYNEAVTGVDKENWVKAIQQEKDSLKKNETWDFVNAEEVKGKKILSSRWIFKIKDGGHYKARLVARGNEQKGLEFYESRSMHEPTNQDIQNVKRTMRYLKQTKTFGLHYSKQDEDMELNAYCDSDFARDMKTRKSTSGYTILFGKGPISWSSRKQPIVALSTTEAEYIAAAECVKELIYMKALIEELTNETILAKLNIDNQSAMTLMKTGQMNRKTKHIDVRYHFLKDQIRENVAVQFCPTQDQRALTIVNLVLEESPRSDATVPERPSTGSHTGAELAPKNEFEMNFSKENSNLKSQRDANSPAGDVHVNPAAARDVTAPPTAASSSATTASPASLNWADSEMVDVDDNKGFTVVKNKKRRRTSTTPERAAKQPSRPAEKPSSQQLRRPTGPKTVPPREIKATRANIADAKKRQATTDHEHYIFVERCPEIPDYTYLKAMSRLVGVPDKITHFGKMNGHFLVGLATKDLARLLVESDFEIGGTTLRVFPYRKRAERIVVAGLPGFVDDFTIVNALGQYGRVTSIAPILIKLGEFAFNDGRREAFILLHEGVRLETLPARLTIQSKGDTLSAYLSFGIKCSKCGRQGHRRASCPSLARRNFDAPKRVDNPAQVQASPSPPVPKRTGPPTPVSSPPAPPAPSEEAPNNAPVTPAAAAPGAPALHPARPLLPPGEAPSSTCSASNPPTTPALPSPAPVEPIEVERIEEEGTGSTQEGRNKIRKELDACLQQAPSTIFDKTIQEGLEKKRVCRLLVSTPLLKKQLPNLKPAQRTALCELVEALLRPALPPSRDIIIGFTIASINARGLAIRNKSLSLCHLLRQHRVDIALVQETNTHHLDGAQDLCLGYDAITAPPDAISGSGLACIYAPGITVSRHRILWPGHIVLATLNVHGQEMTVINVHLSHDQRERIEQLRVIEAAAVEEEEEAWVLGDFNIRDDRNRDSISMAALGALCESAALLDAAPEFDAAHLPTRVAAHGDLIEICLVPKARGGGRGLDSYRPISLPSADYRVIGSILLGRLRPHLSTLVPECQTYAVPGRSPSWNIARVTDAVEEATARGTPLAAVSVDLQSAFDSLDRGYLTSLLVSHLRLPPAFVGWTLLLYAGADATIKVGGFQTVAFKLLNGVRQGCALSAALFSIATGPLLRRLETILGVGNVIAYADDIVLLFHRDEEFERVATVLGDFRRASGIAVNLGKSAGLWCGAWRNRGDSPLGASWSTTSIRVLGLDIAPRSSVAHQEQHLLALLESACRRWTPFTRGLSLVGRARAANSLVGSTIQHHLHGYLPSPPTIAKLQARLARFVWGPEHTAWLPAAVMARPVAIGGLGLLDLATQLQLACLKGVQVALRGGRNGFSWLVTSEAWLRPPPDGTTLQPRRLRLLKLWEEASNILGLNHRAVPTAQLLDLPIIGGCRFLRPPDLLAPARWRGARVRDLIEEEHLIARPTRSALADAATLGAFCRRLTSENAVGFGGESPSSSSSSLAAAVVLRGTATPFLNGLTTRSARRALDRPRLAATPISRFLARWAPTISPPSRIDWASLRRCAFSGQ
ncbi:FHDC1 [Cordylochernes scorpioides]|uniref:FHDC1 n=1 Tax=Cordylochernes scorpioides TaxID=51811 RepID=A0ABY6LT93_9ARAC|nr:FHDC1 [Cordylochernes scorpioides]